MSNDAKPDNATFLSRWSQRKAAATAPASSTSTADATTNTSTGAVAGAGAEMPGSPHSQPDLAANPDSSVELPAVDSLTDDADFTPFMARDVDPGLRNQAMKKLFSNPHYRFEQMDKLDIYIDDYSQPDPIPPEMLRQLNQAKSLFLFDDEDASPPEVAAGPAVLPEPVPGPPAGSLIEADSAAAAGPVTIVTEIPEKFTGLNVVQK